MPEEAEMVYTRIRAKWGITPGAPSPVSPESLANMAQQITSQPVPDLMAKNVQQQQQQQQQQQSQAMLPTSIAQYPIGFTAHMAPSPSETINSRRTSGGMSLPPASAAELSRDAHRIRASTYLTKAQQDAWNAHQARMAANAMANSNRTTGSGERTAATMFGGVDSLIEETQDWIFKDQNQFAMGFENWGSEPPDWGAMDLSFLDYTDGTGSSTNGNTNGNSPAYTGGMQYSYDPTTAPNSGVPMNGSGGYQTGFTNTGYPTTSTEMNGMSSDAMNNNLMNSGMGPGLAMGMGMGATNGNGSMAATMGNMNTNMGRGGGGMKRTSQNLGFDGEVYY